MVSIDDTADTAAETDGEDDEVARLEQDREYNPDRAAEGAVTMTGVEDALAAFLDEE